MKSRGERQIAKPKQSRPAKRPVRYCIVPRDLVRKLHEPLRRHFRDDPSVEVVIERRSSDRRGGAERRSKAAERRAERRLINNPAGRRIGERRASLTPAEPLPLPRRAQRYADRLTFVQALEPSELQAEDLDTARLVTRFQAGDREAYATIYTRYFDRIYTYFRVAFDDPYEAEDAAQQVFVNALEALPRYERRRQPFRGWLFVIVKNLTLTQLEKRSRYDVVDPAELNRRHEPVTDEDAELRALDWINDIDLLKFTEKLPLPQRQVLLLRYMLDLPAAQIAAILGRTASDVRRLQSRAIQFLRERLTSIGREPKRDGDAAAPMRRWAKQATVIRRRRTALL